MSKSKRFGSHKKTLRFDVQKHESHNSLKGILDYKRVKSRIGQPGYISRGCSSLLTPGNRMANTEYWKYVEPMVFPKTTDHVQKNETSYKTAQKWEDSLRQHPGPSSLKQGLVSRKFTTPKKIRNRLATARIEKNGQEPKMPEKTVGKLEKAAVPKPNLKSRFRKIGSIKCTSSLAPSSRIIGGCFKAHALPFEVPEYQCPVKLTSCKEPEKFETNLFEYCPESKPETLDSSCSHARTSRRGSSVSFHEPVAAEIPICDPPFRDCPCSESDDPMPEEEVTQPAPETDHLIPVTTCEQPKEKTNPKKKSKKRSGGKCKRPIIVVPVGEEFQNDHKEEKSQPKASKSSISSGPSILNPISPSHSKHKSFIPYTRSSFHPVDSLNNLHVHTSGASNRDTSPPVPSNAPQSTPCPDCDELSKQVDKLTRKVLRLENIKIPAIRQEVDCLKATIKCLSEKPEKEPEPRHEPCSNLEKKSLSTCQFCQGRNLPVLDSFKRQLMETIGKLCYTEVVISIFLRADNIYHVNVRELKSGSSLACFLVTDDAIMEVQRMGLFKEILTFSVIDSRNTLKPKNCALGITFELVNTERQKGGCDSADHSVCITCRPFLARILGLPLQRLKHVYTDPEIRAKYLRKSLQKHRSGTGRDKSN